MAQGISSTSGLDDGFTLDEDRQLRAGPLDQRPYVQPRNNQDVVRRAVEQGTIMPGFFLGDDMAWLDSLTEEDTAGELMQKLADPSGGAALGPGSMTAVLGLIDRNRERHQLSLKTQRERDALLDGMDIVDDQGRRENEFGPMALRPDLLTPTRQIGFKPDPLKGFGELITHLVLTGPVGNLANPVLDALERLERESQQKLGESQGQNPVFNELSKFGGLGIFMPSWLKRGIDPNYKPGAATETLDSSTEARMTAIRRELDGSNTVEEMDELFGGRYADQPRLRLAAMQSRLELEQATDQLIEELQWYTPDIDEDQLIQEVATMHAIGMQNIDDALGNKGKQLATTLTVDPLNLLDLLPFGAIVRAARAGRKAAKGIRTPFELTERLKEIDPRYVASSEQSVRDAVQAQIRRRKTLAEKGGTAGPPLSQQGGEAETDVLAQGLEVHRQVTEQVDAKFIQSYLDRAARGEVQTPFTEPLAKDPSLTRMTAHDRAEQALMDTLGEGGPPGSVIDESTTRRMLTAPGPGAIDQRPGITAALEQGPVHTNIPGEHFMLGDVLGNHGGAMGGGVRLKVEDYWRGGTGSGAASGSHANWIAFRPTDAEGGHANMMRAIAMRNADDTPVNEIKVMSVYIDTDPASGANAIVGFEGWSRNPNGGKINPRYLDPLATHQAAGRTQGKSLELDRLWAGTDGWNLTDDVVDKGVASGALKPNIPMTVGGTPLDPAQAVWKRDRTFQNQFHRVETHTLDDMEAWPDMTREWLAAYNSSGEHNIKRVMYVADADGHALGTVRTKIGSTEPYERGGATKRHPDHSLYAGQPILEVETLGRVTDFMWVPLKEAERIIGEKIFRVPPSAIESEYVRHSAGHSHMDDLQLVYQQPPGTGPGQGVSPWSRGASPHPEMRHMSEMGETAQKVLQDTEEWMFDLHHDTPHPYGELERETRPRWSIDELKDENSAWVLEGWQYPTVIRGGNGEFYVRMQQTPARQKLGVSAHGALMNALVTDPYPANSLGEGLTTDGAQATESLMRRTISHTARARRGRLGEDDEIAGMLGELGQQKILPSPMLLKTDTGMELVGGGKAPYSGQAAVWGGTPPVVPIDIADSHLPQPLPPPSGPTPPPSGTAEPFDPDDWVGQPDLDWLSQQVDTPSAYD